MKIVAKTKKRLKWLINEIRTQKQHEADMEGARARSPYYHVGLQILQACDWYYHDGLDIATVMETINHALREPVNLTTGARFHGILDPYADYEPAKQPSLDYEHVVIYTRHELRPHNTLTANMVYMIDNTVGLWYDGYYSDKLAMNLLQGYAIVLVSGWSGRRKPLAYRAGG